jgi:hypothetical protein
MKNILSIIRNDPYYSQKNSYLWFKDKIAELLGNKPLGSLTFLGDNQKGQTTSVKMGHMYMYIYYPKNAKTLKVYDKFPVVFPFAEDDKHFWAINAHYLPPMYRIALLNKLLQFKTTNQSGSDYLNFSWQLIKNFSKFKEVAPTVHCYLKGYVKSRFLEIPSKDWPTAVMLPFNTFAKAPESDVFRDSREKMKAVK